MKTALKKKPAEEKGEFIKDYLDLVQTIAAQVTSSTKLPPGFTFDDLVSFGVEGLVKGWERFDKKKGASFRTYASYRVRGEMLDRIREEWRYRNFVLPKIQRKIVDFARETLEFSESEGSSKERFSEIIANSAIIYMLSVDGMTSEGMISGKKGMGDPQEEVLDDLEFDQQRSILREVIDSTLTEEEKKVVEFFYQQELTQKDIASLMSLSRSRVNRLHTQILNKLRKKLKESLVSVERGE